MKLISPFKAIRPKPEYADKIIAPPYDVLNTAEAKEKAKDNPYSFLHISKAEIDCADNIDPYDEKVYLTAKKNFDSLCNKNILIQDDTPSYYIYRLTMNSHQQTGIVASASSQAYLENKIIKHEFTRPDKENDRINHIKALSAHTGPVMLAYKHQKSITDLINSLTKTSTTYNVLGDHNVRHEIWVVNNQRDIDAINTAFNNIDKLYIADGHHRSAAGSQISPNDGFLAVIFPDDQLNILSYHRVIRDLNGHTADEFIRVLSKQFNIKKTDSGFLPDTQHEFGMFMDGQWYHLTLNLKNDFNTPLQSLDVSALNKTIIEPLLGITDQRRDKRIDFVGGIRGLKELEKRVNSGEMALAFSIAPTPIDQLFAVADSGDVMPPKSTWFEPKLADGLLSLLI